ncbi:hypothetical protein FGO68_gene15611 [Halteria grandinella]|uniref:Uncharacterized protein n=1 Tax=Halteria grandinella TaxID=5974 RepID=A0A8J8NDA1_HALGN|nr:hypothetical protein FGO68_gene15611 [Halteria grandinella]
MCVQTQTPKINNKNKQHKTKEKGQESTETTYKHQEALKLINFFSFFNQVFYIIIVNYEKRRLSLTKYSSPLFPWKQASIYQKDSDGALRGISGKSFRNYHRVDGCETDRFWKEAKFHAQPSL